MVDWKTTVIVVVIATQVREEIQIILWRIGVWVGWVIGIITVVSQIEATSRRYRWGEIVAGVTSWSGGRIIQKL